MEQLGELSSFSGPEMERFRTAMSLYQDTLARVQAGTATESDLASVFKDLGRASADIVPLIIEMEGLDGLMQRFGETAGFSRSQLAAMLGNKEAVDGFMTLTGSSPTNGTE